jgi:hypothetical protein
MTRDAVTGDQLPPSRLPFPVVYLTDMSQFGTMNEAYRRHFTEPCPARAAIGAGYRFTAPP